MSYLKLSIHLFPHPTPPYGCLRQLRAWAPNQKKQQRFSVQKRILKLWNFNSGSSTLLSSSIHWIGRILGREENAKVIAADGRKLFYQNPTATRSFHCRTCDYTKLQEYTGYEQQNAKHTHTMQTGERINPFKDTIRGPPPAFSIPFETRNTQELRRHGGKFSSNMHRSPIDEM